MLLREAQIRFPLTLSAINTPELISGRQRTSSGASAWWWLLTPEGGQTGADGIFIRTGGRIDTGIDAWNGPKVDRLGAGRFCSPAWTATWTKSGL